MKNLTKVIALTASLLASSLYAGNYDDMYFGIGAYQSKIDGMTTTYTAASGAITSGDVEYKNNNYKALIGKRINNNWSVEAHYFNFSKDSVKITKVVGNNAANLTLFDVSGDSLGVVGLYHFNPQASYSPFMKLGWHSWNLKFADTKVKGNDELYGVGVDGKINETMKYRVEFERMKMKKGKSNSMDNIGVTLLVDF